ncbi:hypothetical protein HK099_004992, partial [Clydaea vesicula]
MGKNLLIFLLTLTYLIGATPTLKTNSYLTFNKRFDEIENLPTNWFYKGCFSEPAIGKLLSNKLPSSDLQTIQSCIKQCSDNGFLTAGVEYGRECYCDKKTELSLSSVPDTECKMKCFGNANQLCGGPNRINIYQYNVKINVNPAPEKILNDLPKSLEDLLKASNIQEGWTYSGCLTEPPIGRLLKSKVLSSDSQTLQSCIQQCADKGFNAAGAEFGRECFCDNATIDLSYAAVDENECKMACPGDKTQKCGGSKRNLFQVIPTSIITSVIATETPTIPSNYKDIGCYSEGKGGRAFSRGKNLNADDMTKEKCSSFCSDLNFNFSGLENGKQCYCANFLTYGSAKISDSNCNVRCGGNSNQICGGGANGGSLNVYSFDGSLPILYNIPSVPAILPPGYSYQGCYLDPTPFRTLTFQNTKIESLTVEKCINHCKSFRLAFAGVQYGKECFCGDQIHPSATKMVEQKCSTSCEGNPGQLCGGGKLSNIFSTSETLFEYNQIEHSGTYKFLTSAPLVPIGAGLMPKGDKIIFTSSTVVGPQNNTNSYEFDYRTLKFRELHTKTDLFCGAGVVLADNYGRHLQASGWFLTALQGIRLLRPEGDWEENWQSLSLQVPRWYPTAITLPNGVLAYLGGATTANGPSQPNVELLPQKGELPIPVDILTETRGHNLYPAGIIMPSGLLYVFAGDKSTLLDWKDNFKVKRNLPLAPSHVSGFGYRTYPYSSSYVLLPLKAPHYTATFLTCGGGGGTSTDPKVSGEGGLAFDTCASINPEEENAEWIVERMPLRRVMGNMLALPDGTFLMVNGAANGVAGFAAAQNPVLGALIYDPERPIGKRFIYGGKTTIPRMYHSGATLLTDGRVLIHGSNAADPKFPPEFGLEIYYPPYLLSKKIKPTIELVESRDITFSQIFKVKVKLEYQGNVKFNIIRVDITTHGMYFDQRFIWLQHSKVDGEDTFNVAAPPNENVVVPGWYLLHAVEDDTPSESIYLRIGGDVQDIFTWPVLPPDAVFSNILTNFTLT